MAGVSHVRGFWGRGEIMRQSGDAVVVTAASKSINESQRSNIGARKMAEHKHGEMNTFVQEKTFEGFIKFSTRTVIVIAVVLLFIAAVNG